MTKQTKTVKPQTQDDFEAELKSEPKVFEGKALGVITLEDGRYQVIKVFLDTKTLEVGSVEVVETTADRNEAVSRFKIQAVHNGIV